MTPDPNEPERMPEAVSESANDRPTSSADSHADKYNDPRAVVTARGIWIGIGVLIFGILGAAGSIYQRKTRLEESRAFWGDDTILALQLAERIRMESVCGVDFKPVELTATPGLGHLRHVLLDDRSYWWESAEQDTVMVHCQETTPAASDQAASD